MKIRNHFVLLTFISSLLFATASCTKKAAYEVPTETKTITETPSNTILIEPELTAPPEITANPIQTTPAPTIKFTPTQAPTRKPTQAPIHTPKATQSDKAVTKDNFLKTAEGKRYKESADKFYEAYITGDRDYIEKIAIDKTTLEESDYEDISSTIKLIEFRIFEYDNKAQIVDAEYIISLETLQMCNYIDFKMQLINGQWKLVSYGADC